MKSSFLADFKKFAMRGNVIDMAVGVIRDCRKKNKTL